MLALPVSVEVLNDLLAKLVSHASFEACSFADGHFDRFNITALVNLLKVVGERLVLRWDLLLVV